MDSSRFQQQDYQHHFEDPQKRQFPRHQNKPPNKLTRFSSAPSSYFASFFDVADSLSTTPTAASTGGSGGGGEREEFSNARPLSPETENIFTTFMSNMGAEPNSSSQKLCDIPENSPVNQPPELMVEVKEERETLQGSFVTSPQPLIYQSQSKPPLANQKNSMKRAFPANSMGVNSMKISKNNSNSNNNKNNNNSGLTRHSSSPAGFFANILNILDNGFGEMKGIGNFSTGQTQAQAQPPSSSGLISQKSIDSIFSENLSNLDDDDDENEDEDQKNFSEFDASENQSGEVNNRPGRLAHHLSLPKTLNDISDMEKLLFEDTVVPCRIRAKRGFATHPRSIAERVRRTKISDRIRKLQDLVPNMDKQTNTAEMLDLAVDYIKDLQKQITGIYF